MNQTTNYAPAEFNSHEGQQRLIACFQSKGWDIPDFFKYENGIYAGLFCLAKDTIFAHSDKNGGGFEYVENARQLLHDLNIYLRRASILFTPEWIEKILSGQKTMTIRRTQYPCGVYDVVTESEPDKVVCRIEIVKVEKWETDKKMSLYEKISDDYGNIIFESSFKKTCNDILLSGFRNIDDFIQYHRDNYAPVKYAHTFELVKGDINVS